MCFDGSDDRPAAVRGESGHEPPRFESILQFRQYRSDVDFWWPHIQEVLERHQLHDETMQPVAGNNVTHPTFVCGDVVVKFFGFSPRGWRRSYRYERAAQQLLENDRSIPAPELLACGSLYQRTDEDWPYLITSRVAGVESWRAGLTNDRQRDLATSLGRQVAKVHQLPVVGVATEADWSPPSITSAAERSSLPAHLVAQAEEFVARLPPADLVFVHSDLTSNHVYVTNGTLSGIIDWGDAMAADRHLDIIQLFRDMFGCDRELLRRFLDAYGWPETKEFPRKALGWALKRQAIGLAQHTGIDVFEPIAGAFPLDDIATLDELAVVLFDV